MQVLITVLFFIALLVGLSALGAVPLYFLWNWLVPALTGWKALTFLQAWGISLLFGIIFKTRVTVRK